MLLRKSWDETRPVHSWLFVVVFATPLAAFATRLVAAAAAAVSASITAAATATALLDWDALACFDEEQPR